MPSPTGNTETGHSGNGFARITLEKIETIYNFEFKPESQEFTAPVTGDYLIELWGAQGGGDEKASGGKGAYTKGIIHLDKDDKLYVYVGGQGTGGQSIQSYAGGYNGGGAIKEIWDADLAIEWTWYGFSGGGSTDVRLNNGEWNNFNSLKSRIMVAAGGGGAMYKIRDNFYYSGGYGGALIGGDSLGFDFDSMPTGGTQTKGGYFKYQPEDGKDNVGGFGYGGSPYPRVVHSGGGGSGYFGGGAAYENLNISGCTPGAGGSSFISGYQGCVAISDTSTEGNIIFKDSCTEENTLNNITCSYHYSGKVFKETNMIAGNSLMPSPDGNTETGHSGNGHARIALLS